MANGTERICVTLPGFNPIQFIEVFGRDLAGNLHCEVAGIKTGDLFHAAFAIENCAAEGRFADSFGLTTPIPVMTARFSIEVIL